jgi:hypothetical protein
MNMRTRLIIVFVVIAIFAATDAFAAIYKYLDEDGMVCIADDLQSIPEQYREQAAIVSGDVEEKKPIPTHLKLPQTQLETRPASTAPSVVQETSPVDSIKKSFSINRVMISIMVVVSALFAFVILGILDADHKKSVKIARMVILWGMSVYLIYAHAGDVVHLFKSTKNTIDAAQQKSREKGEKATKALKNINSLLQNVDNADSPAPARADPEKRD